MFVNLVAEEVRIIVPTSTYEEILKYSIGYLLC